jgi:hypothetical protein
MNLCIDMPLCCSILIRKIKTVAKSPVLSSKKQEEVKKKKKDILANFKPSGVVLCKTELTLWDTTTIWL